MATTLDQNENAFQKQPTIFLGAKKRVLAKRIDKKCPFTGNVSIRGRILKGICISTKMKRSIIIRRDYLRYVKKYRRFEKRHKNIAAHVSPCFEIKEGDILTIGQCRPLSKTIRFNVLKVEPQRVGAKKTFRMF